MKKEDLMFYRTLFEAIGNTPLIKVPFDSPATILAKLEYLNPGGSVKDRSALFMIEQAEQQGILKPGGTIIDASSGNHGIALAMIGAVKKYRVIITVSEKISQEKYKALRAYGAEVVMCPATKFIDDPQSYHSVAQKIHAETPGSFMPNQYYNVANRKAHYTLTGPEIWEQTEGKITHLFAGAGTGGTVSGIGEYLKEQNENVKIYAIDSAHSLRATKGNPQPYVVEGIGIDFYSDVIKYDVIDDIINITDYDATQLLKKLSRDYGLLVGPSSGAIAAGTLQYLNTFTKDDVVVMIFSDSGRAYLSRDFYDLPDQKPDQPYLHGASSDSPDSDSSATMS